DRNRSHWSTSKTPSYTKSVSWQHHLQDLRKICTPQASLSDEAWEKLMLSDENNKQHIREAIVAMERNNQSNYWEALGKVECPDM
ncbi:hypothetical protein OSK19_20895, partial [Escherichia coli]|nr:hypothetical protein [Escherichia coli]